MGQINGYWYSRLDGKKSYLSSVDENSAWKKLLELQGETTDRAKPKTMMKACEDWCTLHASTWERGRAKHFATWCHRRRLKVDAIDNDMFARWVKWCQAKFAPKTVRHNVYVARKILTWCQEHGWIQRIPRSPKLAKPVQRPKDLNDGQINDAWSDLRERAKRIATFVLETGCRPGEARKLHWADVDLKRNVCILSAHKTARTGRPRMIFLTATAQAILEGLPTRTGYVFLNRLEKPYTEQGLKAIIVAAASTCTLYVTHVRNECLTREWRSRT